jgi:glycosyltransferase involved in cell wall biosynthesis
LQILFIHQNMPGQFVHLARHYAADRRNRVAFVTRRREVQMPGVTKVQYELAPPAGRTPHSFLNNLQNSVVFGEAVLRTLQALVAQRSFRPDVIVAHPGWGESLFVKDAFPDVPLLNYIEFFYRAFGADTFFDPEEPFSPEDVLRIRIKNANNLLNLESCDWGLCPTYWQWWQQPPGFRQKLSVIHDGINTDTVRPDPEASVTLPNGRTLTRADPVVTYVSRNLEPYRGFPQFMRAAEMILARHSGAQILVVGGDQSGYGRQAPEGMSYRDMLLREVKLDRERIHFLGRLPYSAYLKVLQVSSAHIYLTVPFVLSWSMLESMAAECLLVASATPPVQEVVVDGENGLLADFFQPEQVAARVLEALERPETLAPLRSKARATILERYALTQCLPRQLALVETLAGGRLPQPEAPPSPHLARVFAERSMSGPRRSVLKSLANAASRRA